MQSLPSYTILAISQSEVVRYLSFCVADHTTEKARRKKRALLIVSCQAFILDCNVCALQHLVVYMFAFCELLVLCTFNFCYGYIVRLDWVEHLMMIIYICAYHDHAQGHAQTACNFCGLH